MRTSLFVVALALAAPALAQDADRLDKRVGKLESEMKAVQRKVFPGGDPRFFEPEIQAPAAPAPTTIGVPATAPLADLSARVDALEAQLRALTGQVEAGQFRLKQLEDAQTKLRGDVEFRLNTLEGNGSAPAIAPAPGPGPAAPPRVTPAPPQGVAAVPAPAAKAPSKPATADAAWTAAYANVTAKNWPATETAMTDFIAAWPKSARLPQARYWLGRSHAQRNQHAQAARAYLELYKTAPRSTQAPDALLGLATAMNGLTKPKDACRVLDELASVYGEKLTPAQQADAKTQRGRAKCAA